MFLWILKENIRENYLKYIWISLIFLNLTHSIKSKTIRLSLYYFLNIDCKLNQFGNDFYKQKIYIHNTSMDVYCPIFYSLCLNYFCALPNSKNNDHILFTRLNFFCKIKYGLKIKIIRYKFKLKIKKQKTILLTYDKNFNFNNN